MSGNEIAIIGAGMTAMQDVQYQFHGHAHL